VTGPELLARRFACLWWFELLVSPASLTATSPGLWGVAPPKRRVMVAGKLGLSQVSDGLHVVLHLLLEEGNKQVRCSIFKRVFISYQGTNSLLRQEEALWRCSTEMCADALPRSLRACCADSATSLEVRDPDLADSIIFTSGTAASRTNP